MWIWFAFGNSTGSVLNIGVAQRPEIFLDAAVDGDAAVGDAVVQRIVVGAPFEIRPSIERADTLTIGE